MEDGSGNSPLSRITRSYDALFRFSLLENGVQMQNTCKIINYITTRNISQRNSKEVEPNGCKANSLSSGLNESLGNFSLP